MFLLPGYMNVSMEHAVGVPVNHQPQQYFGQQTGHAYQYAYRYALRGTLQSLSNQFV
jgi:hypothetical protein